MAKVSTRPLPGIGSPTVPRKIPRRSESPRRRLMSSSFPVYKIIFEYGPPQLNLFKYVVKKTMILWEEARKKCILKDDGKPTDELILICGDDSKAADCLRIFGFDVYHQEQLDETECTLTDQQKSVCLFNFGEQFWKKMNKARMGTVWNIIKDTSKDKVFFMTVSDVERDEVIKCCKKYNLASSFHIISPASDNTMFYEAFYKVLSEKLQTFSSDLETRTSTRQIHAIKCKLNSLIGKLQSRNARPPLTKQCLDKIKGASKDGVVGYRLFGNDLHIYGNEQLTTWKEKSLEIETSIQETFNGQVHLRSLKNAFEPQCTVKCGDYLQSKSTGRKGTIGIFGEMKTVKKDSVHIVALSSPHVISSGDIACSSTEDRFGECIWPKTSENIHDVSIIQIDPSSINTIQRTILNENIKIEEIPKESLLYRQVFKYGAATQKTCGSIEQVDDFQLFGSDVMTISSDVARSPFSKNGDSGAIVVTKFEEKLHGIGVIYGGNVDDRGAKTSITGNETIAIFLKNALDRFVEEKKVNVEFDDI